MPDIHVGKHCDNPHKCSFKHHCWKNVPEHSVFTIPRIGEKKINQLLDSGIMHVTDVPSDFELSKTQAAHVRLMQSGKPKIERQKIKSLLSDLKYPLYFLDFETDAPPIPRLEKMRPYSKIPFQYSLHVLHENKELEHLEFLHLDESDPREAMAKQLVEEIGKEGSVIAYYAALSVVCLKIWLIMQMSMQRSYLK